MDIHLPRIEREVVLTGPSAADSSLFKSQSIKICFEDVLGSLQLISETFLRQGQESSGHLGPVVLCVASSGRFWEQPLKGGGMNGSMGTGWLVPWDSGLKGIPEGSVWKVGLVWPSIDQWLSAVALRNSMTLDDDAPRACPDEWLSGQRSS